MTIALLAIALLTLASATVAMALRNLIHSALLLIASWAGVAFFYLWAGAEFVAFAQVLVYVGAISMVVLFAVLLTRRTLHDVILGPESIARVIPGLITGGAVLGVLFGAVLSAPLKTPAVQPVPTLTVREIGLQLMGPHAGALLVVGLLLTVALLGGVVIASGETRRDREDQS